MVAFATCKRGSCASRCANTCAHTLVFRGLCLTRIPWLLPMILSGVSHGGHERKAWIQSRWDWAIVSIADYVLPYARPGLIFAKASNMSASDVAPVSMH